MPMPSRGREFRPIAETKVRRSPCVTGIENYEMTKPPSTLVELLQARAADAPERVAFTWLTDGESHENSLTFGQLEQRARAIAARLHELNAAGERVLLAFPTGLDFIA